MDTRETSRETETVIFDSICELPLRVEMRRSSRSQAELEKVLETSDYKVIGDYEHWTVNQRVAGSIPEGGSN